MERNLNLNVYKEEVKYRMSGSRRSGYRVVGHTNIQWNIEEKDNIR